MAEDRLPPLRETIARHGLAARKSLGQHFLLDLNLTGRIARAAGDLERGTTIEIGPGPGGLTRALLAHGAARVIAVERDERCLAALAEIAAAWPGRLASRATSAPPVPAFARHFRMPEIIAEHPASAETCGNRGCPKFPRRPEFPCKWDASASAGPAGRRPARAAVADA